MTSPYAVPCRFCLQRRDFESGKRFSNISGHKYWLYGVTLKDNREAELSYGYLLHLIVLYATSLNLKTVWLIGPFYSNYFNTLLFDEEKECIPCVSPVGLADESGAVQRKRRRKELNELFFVNNLKTPIDEKNAPKIFERKILEEIKFGPSAKNYQEWRFVLCESEIHLFGVMGKFTVIDMGICTAQVHVALCGNGVNGHFEKRKISFEIPKGCEYFITFVID
ncbi:hypothetical protein EIN_330650 [Entamoeba invadens IP1]|uniref:Putative nitroreductase TM1586 domain-containing protein n=1 Tax=Entamoeba invadens IP1 TaxID=370355 RepID=L7FNT4_ENTIV|nr:hypothetical protein EIN_330650 [Entamoeba invadens IP1]ELP88761.1 hypothetical protein EIN_330650 [Entamoeba invadens IP1]|eukprot:XP_004255532.1 hypothetical protein EIN_330650 [Entamoeba invadens IP1]